MVLDVTGFFGGQKKSKGRPLLNQIPININDNAAYGISTVHTQKQKFMRWFKQRPELCSPVMLRVDDTITELEVYGKDGFSPLGRNKRIEARKFLDDNQVHERLKSFQFDRLVTGSGFIWKGALSNVDKKEKEVVLSQLKSVCERVARTHIQGLNLREQNIVAQQLFLRTIDEDLRLPRKIDYVPSSTVLIEHDRYDVKRYVQYFSSWMEKFKPDEIVHVPLHRVDGKVDGFTPVESLGYELVLLWAIKENMLSFFRNGGTPNKLFILPDEMNNSENFLWVKQQLMDMGQIERRHGNLVLTGEVKVEDLEANPKDMEYKDLSLFIAGNIAYALRVPVSRIPYLLGQSSSKGDASGMAESGYWSMIESDQRTIESALNSQIFSKLGFTIKFKKRYKLDDLKEAQAYNFRVDAFSKMQMELAKQGYKLSKQKTEELLGLSSSDIIEDKSVIPMDPGKLGRSFAPNSVVESEMDKNNKNETKRT